MAWASTFSWLRLFAAGLNVALSFACALPGPDDPAPPILTVEGTVYRREVCPRCAVSTCEEEESAPQPCREDPLEDGASLDGDALQWVWLLRGQLDRPFTQGAETATIDAEGRYRLEIRRAPPLEARFQGQARENGPPGTVAFGFLSQAAEDGSERLHILERLRPFALVMGATSLEEPPLPPGWSAPPITEDEVIPDFVPLPETTVTMDLVWLAESRPVPIRSCASVQRIRTVETVSSEDALQRLQMRGPEEWECFDREAGLAGFWACPDFESLLCTPVCEVDVLDLAPGEPAPPGWPCPREDP